MKSLFFFILISMMSLSMLFAQQENLESKEQVIILDGGMLLKGEVEQVNKKSIRFSNDDTYFIIQQKNIQAKFPSEFFESKRNRDTESLIVLKSNEWLKAQILEITAEKIILHSNGVRSVFPMGEIAKIYPAGKDAELFEKKLIKDELYSHLDLSNINKEVDREMASKIYHITYGRYFSRSNTKRMFESNFNEVGKSVGFGFQQTTGYEINRYFGLGLSIGLIYYIDNFEVGMFNNCAENCEYLSNVGDINVLSTSINLRGALSERKISPYYNIDIGFNKYLLNQKAKNRIAEIEINQNLDYDSNASRTKLGLLFQPSVGMQYELKSMTFLIDLGFQYANLNFSKDRINGEMDSFYLLSGQSKDMSFVLKLGIML